MNKTRNLRLINRHDLGHATTPGCVTFGGRAPWGRGYSDFFLLYGLVINYGILVSLWCTLALVFNF